MVYEEGYEDVFPTNVRRDRFQVMADAAHPGTFVVMDNDTNTRGSRGPAAVIEGLANEAEAHWCADKLAEARPLIAAVTYGGSVNYRIFTGVWKNSDRIVDRAGVASVFDPATGRVQHFHTLDGGVPKAFQDAIADLRGRHRGAAETIMYKIAGCHLR